MRKQEIFNFKELLELYKKYLIQANQEKLCISNGYHDNGHDNSGGHPNYHNDTHDNTPRFTRIKKI